MRVEKIRIAPAAASRVRLEAQVRYDDRPRRPEAIWFEVSDSLAGSLDDSTGNAFLAALLPLATVLEQRLEIEAPVDEPLLRHASEIRACWAGWYGTRKDLEISAPTRPCPGARPAGRAAFFSGGVDSTYTAWRGAGLLDAAPAPRTLDELLFVEGFDIPLNATAALDAARANALSAAQKIGLPLTTIGTNLRVTRWREADWALLAHGAALAAVALALGGRLGEARIAASVFAGRDAAWGSHPETTARYSSWTLALHEDGFEIDRMPKLRALARHPAAIGHLRVCWSSPTGENCGICKKCILVRVMLDLILGETSCPVLPRPADMLVRLRDLPVHSGDEWDNVREIQREALARGRADVVEATTQALSGDPTVRDQVTIQRPRSMRPSWWRRLATRR